MSNELCRVLNYFERPEKQVVVRCLRTIDWMIGTAEMPKISGFGRARGGGYPVDALGGLMRMFRGRQLQLH